MDVRLIHVAGQSVRTLFSGTVAANEMQTIAINAEALPSGTYIVHFQNAPGLDASEPIVLAK